MKTDQKPDKRFHIRKKVALGTAGTVVGAAVGGPVGALVGGVIGTVVGGAAETGKLQALANPDGNNSQPIKKTAAVAKREIRNVKPAVKKAVRKGRAVRPKSKAKSRR